MTTSSLSCHYLHAPLSRSVLIQSPHKGFPNALNPTPSFKGCRKRLQLLCSSKNHQQDPNSMNSSSLGVEDQDNRTGRREVLFHSAFATFSLPVIVCQASAETEAVDDFRVYLDDVNKFKITIPKDWQVGAGETDGIRSLTAFYPDEPSNANVSVVITGLGADFTRLESFGKVDEFAETLVSGLDRSWQRPPGVAAKLIDSKASKGLYYIQYTLQNPGESRRYLYSVLGMANNGLYNRLYTVTGQFVEKDAEKYGSKIQKAVSSFKFI